MFFKTAIIYTHIYYILGLSSCAMMAWHPAWFGSTSNPSYIPSIYMAHPTPMTFLERAENTLMHLGNTNVSLT